MDRIDSMQAFVGVVETGGFSGAARRLGLSRTMVTKHIQALESRLGARLLNRTTRRVSVTEIGALYLERCVQILAELEAAELAVGELHGQPRGTLKVNAPMSFGIRHLAPIVGAFTTAHPEVTLDLTLNDRVVDLVEEGFDIAIRIGRLPDSSLTARRLAECPILSCAAPAYLARRGVPAVPADLKGHNCLGYSYWSLRDEWRFTGPDGQEASVRVAGTLRANNGDVLRTAAEAGLGIIQQPVFLVADALRAGTLVPVLPGWQGPMLGIYAIWPPGRLVTAKLRAFVDALVAGFRTPPWEDCPGVSTAA